MREDNHDYPNNGLDVIIAVLCEMSSNQCVLNIPFIQHYKVDCEYCNVEEEWEQDESNNPSQEVLGDVHLEPENTIKLLLANIISCQCH